MVSHNEIIRLREDQEFRDRVLALATKLSDLTGINPTKILSRDRTKRVSEARAMIAFTLRNAGFGFTQIGKILDRDHSTIIYHVDTLTKRCTDPSFTDINLKRNLRFLRDYNDKLTETWIANTLSGPAI